MKLSELKQYIHYKAYNKEQEEELINLIKPYLRKYPNNITGDVCQGDIICFIREEWGGSYKKPKFLGFFIVEGKVINDSYGKDKQQHTFTIKTKTGTTLIKGRNLYKYIVLAKKRNEDERKLSLEDKHKRGDIARERKIYRRNRQYDENYIWNSL